MLNEMVAELMRSHRMDYQEALETVVASKTYKRLLTDEDLQEEDPSRGLSHPCHL